MRPITQKTEKGRIITSRIPPPTDGVFCKALFCTGKRSEEHTSELQSRSDLVCRLLLEKKNSEPGEQGGILHRVPCLVPDPAQLYGRPPHPQTDADRDKQRGQQRPLADRDQPVDGEAL